MLKKYIGLTLVMSFILISMGAMAQGGGPPDCPGQPGVQPPCGNPPPPPGLPIDGGLGALLVIGAAYGIKKLHEKN